MIVDTRGLQIITPPLRGALIFTLFWGFRKFRGALIFFKKFAEILGCVYLHGFWWGALIFTFFLVDFSKDLHCKTPVLQKFPAARAKFLGSAYFRIFSRSAYYFHFSAFRKFWRALIILRKSSEMTLERLLRGGYYLQYPGSEIEFYQGRMSNYAFNSVLRKAYR